MQFRRPKSTVETAHGFHREGSFYTGQEHQLSDDEQTKFWEEESERLFVDAKANFPRGLNLEYALLKGHLIIERALGHYIRCHSSVLVDENDLKFSFRQKLDVAYLMGFGVNDPVLLPTVERWNSIRNKVAHTFQLDRDRVDEMIRINSEDYADFALVSDQQRISRLRNMCYSICGRVAGESASHTYWEIAKVEAYRLTLNTGLHIQEGS